MRNIILAAIFLQMSAATAAANPREAFEEVICRDNAMEPWRVCVGASFVKANDILSRIGVVYGSTRFRMNATNVGKLRQRMSSWANGSHRVPFMPPASLAGADGNTCLQFDSSSWSDLAKATSCGFPFPGFFDFEEWLDWIASFAFDKATYQATTAIFDRYGSEICRSNLAPWFDGNMLAVPLPGPRRSEREVEAAVGAANRDVQTLIARNPNRRDQILLAMTVKSYACDSRLP